MATGGSAKPKEAPVREKKHFPTDMVKSDGQFKEMIAMQELARNGWDGRWNFMNKEHILKIYEESAAEMNLPLNFMINRRRKKTFEREYSGKQPLVSSPAVPTLTSGSH
ncbi:hypothetical protein J6590_077024 [Homalodisca vitripennis]|nr:hypothetical protein J6590_077024 [Homalodisca vitripennis]